MDECLAVLEHLCPPFEEEFAGLYEGKPVADDCDDDDDDDLNNACTDEQF